MCEIVGSRETFADDLHELVDLLHALVEIARVVHRRAQSESCQDIDMKIIMPILQLFPKQDRTLLSKNL
jgi:hypothetical protein